MSDVLAPWDDATVLALNASQRYGHGFTCAEHTSVLLIASRDGWFCPVDTCQYRQWWAMDVQVDIGKQMLAGKWKSEADFWANQMLNPPEEAP